MLSQYLRFPLSLLLLLLLIAHTFGPPNAEQQIMESIASATSQYRKRVERTVEDAMRRMLETLDTDGDGHIAMDEVRNHAFTTMAKIRNSTPSAREFGVALSHFTWAEIFWRYFLLQLAFLTFLFVLVNIQSIIFPGPRRLRLDNSYLTADPPKAGADVALTYDTPWTLYERIKLAFFLCTGLLFLRICTLYLFGLLALFCVNLSNWAGHTRHDNPIWFSVCTNIACLSAHIALAAIGIYNIKIYGKVADRSQCKILIGNHACVIEVVILFILGNLPSFVTREENTRIPLFGGLASASDAIIVNRDAALSRQQTADAILSRAKNRRPSAPQLVICPEGTTSNQRSLFLFKRGAFEAGEPVQMICVSFPYKHFNPSWTGRATGGNSMSDLILRLCIQFVNYAEVRVLPVYVPTEEERNNPLEYAEHCQRMMAATLRCSVSSFTLRDYENLVKSKN